MDKNPHSWIEKDSNGKCPSCGRTAGCNCNAAHGDWEETQWDAKQEEIDQLEYEQFEDDNGRGPIPTFWLEDEEGVGAVPEED